MWANHNQKGFTIVELLIVIVVIGILAAITITAYRGIQDRAAYTKSYAALTQVNKAIKLYYAENDKYPVFSSFVFYCADPAAFLSVITTSSIPPAPCTDANTSYDTWAYRSSPTGNDYKLIYNRPTMTTGVKNQIPSDLYDPSRWSANGAWGFWSAGGNAL